jgi:hypothetical protein
MADGASNRWKWPRPSLGELTKALQLHGTDATEPRARRLQFVLEELGPSADMLLMGGASAMYAWQELKWTYVEGHFLATVLTAQVFIETQLGGRFILSQEDDAVERGLGELIRRAEKNGLIPHIAERLRELHKMRIAYGHIHIGLHPRSHMKRILDRQMDPNLLLEDDAKTAIQIVADYLRYNQPSWNPDNSDCKSLLDEQYGGKATLDDEDDQPCLV